LRSSNAYWVGILLAFLSGLASADEWQSLQDSAKSLVEKGQDRLALEPALKALSIAERNSRAAGRDSQLALATSLNMVGDIRTYLGQFSAAEPLLKRALEIRESKAGAGEAIVAQSLHSLGRLYLAQGRNETARPIIERAVAIRERVLGPDHPDLARSLSNLGYAIESNPGDEAEKLYLRAAGIFEKNPGPDRIPLVTNKIRLMWLYYQRNRIGDAQDVCKDLIPSLEKQDGPDPLALAMGLDGCAYVDFGNAEAMLVRALAIREKSFGPDDPHVARGLVRLGGEYFNKRKYTLAQPLLGQAVSILEKGPGLVADLQLAIITLAEVHYGKREFDKAVARFEQTISIKTDNPDRPLRMEDKHYRHLAASYGQMRQFAKAAKHYERLLDESKKRNQYADLDLVDDLSAMYVAMGRLTDAASLNEEVLAAKRANLKPNHQDIATSLFHLEKIYRLQGRALEAKDALLQASVIRTRDLRQFEARLDGKNCDLAVPPFEAARGAFPPHAYRMRMYPLAPGTTYSGCLWIWISYDSKTSWDYRVVAKYESGSPVFYREAMNTFDGLITCSYRDGIALETSSTTGDKPWKRYCRSAENLRALLTITPPEDDWWEFW